LIKTATGPTGTLYFVCQKRKQRLTSSGSKKFSTSQKQIYQEAFFLSLSKTSGQQVTCKSTSRPCRSLSPSMQRNSASSLQSTHAAVGQAPRGSLAHRMVDNAHVRAPYVRPHAPMPKRQTPRAHADEWQGDSALAPRQHTTSALYDGPAQKPQALSAQAHVHPSALPSEKVARSADNSRRHLSVRSTNKTTAPTNRDTLLGVKDELTQIFI
jgi:hypothetical protein